MSSKEQETEVKRTTLGAAGTGEPPAKERDFGETAGYGGGGSSQDYHDVVGENPEPKKHNPLDAVMTKPEKSGS